MWIQRIALFGFVLNILFASSIQAEEKSSNVKVGDQAPVFSGTDDANKPWDSKNFVGKKILVVYFYPADMTGGCTKQACNYRDALKDLKRDDVEIIGVSGDSAENHQQFKNEYDLNFTLLADSEGKIAKAFGVQLGEGGSIERVIQGKDVTLTRGVTAKRWTFVIDKQGRIAHKDTKVNAAKDTETVLAIVEKL